MTHLDALQLRIVEAGQEMIVEVHPWGVTLRQRRGRKRLRVTWEAMARAGNAHAEQVDRQGDVLDGGLTEAQHRRGALHWLGLQNFAGIDPPQAPSPKPQEPRTKNQEPRTKNGDS